VRKKKSPILEAVHETAKGLHDAGVMDQVTLGNLNECLDSSEVGNWPEESDRHGAQTFTSSPETRT